MLGPSIIGQSEFLKKWLFSPKTFYISQTIAYFGCMMFNFLIGVKVDVTLMTRLGKKAWAIGIFSLLIPLIMSTIILLLLRLVLTLDPISFKSLFAIVFVFSTGSVHSTAVHLADLKLLNTEIGDIALSASMVNGIICLVLITAVNTQKQSSLKKDKSYNWMTVSFLVMVVFIICVLRPIMLWMVRKTPEGKPIKESYIMYVFLMLLGCAFVSELIGERYLVGAVILGMAVPDGPPLGSALAERLDTMVSAVYLPLYFLYMANKFKLFLIDARSFLIVQVVAIIATLGKIAGTMLPSIYWKMPVTDVLSLGLLMSANGITQFIYLQTALNLKVRNIITFFSFSIMYVVNLHQEQNEE
jgi:Kef-type K+ transport system membrane component KefB